MLPAFPNVTTQIDNDNNDVDLDDLKSLVLSNKQVMLKWIQTTEKQLEDEIKLTKTKILTESRKEINYVDEILKEKSTIIRSERSKTKDASKSERSSVLNADEQLECKYPNLPYYCSEHISQDSDQFFKQRCSFILSNSQRCPNSALLEDKKKSQFCQRHLKLIKKQNENEEKDKKDNKEKTSKPKRKYVKNNGTTNENKPRKPRKKKDVTSLSNGDSAISNGTNNLSLNVASQEANSFIDNPPVSNFDKSQQQQQRSFTSFINSNLNTCYLTSLNDHPATQYGYTMIGTADHHGLISANQHYVPCISNATGLNSNSSLNGNLNGNLDNNLNQLSNLTHSEDSLALAIVGNGDDLTSVPFEESELTEMLGKIPEDAFNDIFMENLSTESSELRAIDNIAFNSDNLDNLEPSISNPAFVSLNFKNGSNGYFGQVSTDQQNSLINNDNLIYNNNDLNNISSTLDLNGGNLNNGGKLICISNGMISTNQSVKEINEHHFAVNGICGTMSNTISSSIPANSATPVTDQQPNYGSSFGVLNYKHQQIQPYPSVIHQNTYSTDTSNGSSFSSNYLHSNVSNYSPAINDHLLSNNGSDNVQAAMLSNGHPNHMLNDYSNSGLSNSLPNNLPVSNSLPSSSSCQLQANQGFLDCTPAKNDDKKFNLFSNCKSKTNDSTDYQPTYSNIYDDLPAFESIRVNTSSSSLPSFSIMKKNRIESR